MIHRNTYNDNTTMTIALAVASIVEVEASFDKALSNLNLYATILHTLDMPTYKDHTDDTANSMWNLAETILAGAMLKMSKVEAIIKERTTRDKYWKTFNNVSAIKDKNIELLAMEAKIGKLKSDNKSDSDEYKKAVSDADRIFKEDTDLIKAVKEMYKADDEHQEAKKNCLELGIHDKQLLE